LSIDEASLPAPGVPLGPCFAIKRRDAYDSRCKYSTAFGRIAGKISALHAVAEEELGQNVQSTARKGPVRVISPDRGAPVDVHVEMAPARRKRPAVADGVADPASYH
jgi:hypothetical protein